MSVDGVWSYVGTQNLDNQSFSHSKEIGFGLDDATQTARLDALFEQHWATSVPAQVFEPPANRVEQLLTRFRSPLASAVHQ